MSRGFPSMTALLGLLAVAGYQNRDKLAEMFRDLTAQPGSVPGAPGGTGAAPSQAQPGGTPGLGGLLAGLGGGGLGSLIGGGVSELVKQFDTAGQRDVADSWVGTGPNKDIAPGDLERAIGPDALDTLTAQTGLTKDEILARLSRELPHAVDQFTPHGRVPSVGDASA